MPRGSQFMVEGYTYHITQRCHDRQFLLRFKKDRDVYREWLREGVRRHRVPLYGFCLTSNHIHLIVHAVSVVKVSLLMHLVSGATAKQYNLRKRRTGSMWEHPFHCTAVETTQHLINCLCYVNLNMVRAGVVQTPEDWKWCGHDELMGTRKRYRILDIDRLLDSLGCHSPTDLTRQYQTSMEMRLSQRTLAREPHWTESLAVGSKSFVQAMEGHYDERRHLTQEEVAGSSPPAWLVREPSASYSVFSGEKTASKPVNL